MYCPNCNKTFPDSHVFCDNCGGKLVNGNGNASPQPPVQNYQPAPAYNPAPGYAPPANKYPTNETVSTIGWVGYFILFAIPLIGFITMLVLAFGNPKKKSVRNYARAVLIMAVIGIVLGAVTYFFMWDTIVDTFYNLGIDISSFSY